jgi:NAD(P)H-flavin reductase
MKNEYQTINARIENIVSETANIKTFTLRPEVSIGFLAGQFMQVTVPGIGECPFTPSSDYKNVETLDFTVMSAGSVTRKLHSMQIGDTLGLRGPFGKRYPIEQFHGKDVYIVGGGVGLAPLRALLFALFHEIDNLNKIVARFGCRSPKDIAYKDAIPVWSKKPKTSIAISVDVGDASWTGSVGIVTTILKDDDVNAKNSVAIVCGPPIMMKFTTFKLIDEGFKPENLYLSMEKNMSCGLGKCGHCRLGKYYVCKDGPVFTFEQIKDLHEIWD